LAQRVWRLILVAIPTLGLALILGRGFCGWVCPMGTLVDILDRFITPRNRYLNDLPLQTGVRPSPEVLRNPKVKYLFLTAFATAILFGVQWVHLLDPIPLLSRLIATGILPQFEWLTRFVFNVFYKTAGIRVVSEPVFALLRNHVLSFKQPYYEWHWLSLLIVVGIALLSRFGRRTWCRVLCPLGGLLSLCSRFAPLRVTCGDACIHCGKCARECKMGAIAPESAEEPFVPQINRHECILCTTCWNICPARTLKPQFAFKTTDQNVGVDLRRRHIIGSMLVGGIAAPLTALKPLRGSETTVRAIRPPGAINESEFLALCIRCGACMKVCPQNALHPSLLNAGIQGLFTPELIPRLGYCHYRCNLCGVVCPTGAIQRLHQETKQRLSIGLAQFRKDRCLPYAQAKNCLVCEEHCPVGEKAIQSRERAVLLPHSGETILVKEPYLVAERCIGCGNCENVCPLEGLAGVTVHPRSEQILLDAVSPQQSPTSPY
ncbi:MAG TPA: 4Fe-4S binding protein, partial [bacterium]|nr:4Fe-4S binding protein [bacterium]